MNKLIPATLLALLSLGLLIPGVTQKMFSMKLDAGISSNLGNFQLNGIEKSYSILGTVEDLWKRDKTFVASLIFIFSIVFPLAKILLYFFMLYFKKFRSKLYIILSQLGKWSMADVFVVGILLAYMATGRETQHAGVHQLNIMGMRIGITLNLNMSSELLHGYYYFLSSCLISILSLSVFPMKKFMEIKD